MNETFHDILLASKVVRQGSNRDNRPFSLHEGTLEAGRIERAGNASNKARLWRWVDFPKLFAGKRALLLVAVEDRKRRLEERVEAASRSVKSAKVYSTVNPFSTWLRRSDTTPRDATLYG